MAELANFWLRPCVVWEILLPTPGNICTSPRFSLRGSDWHLSFDTYGDTVCNLFLHQLLERILSEQEVFTVTTFLHNPNRRTDGPLLSVQTVGSGGIIKLWRGNRNDIAGSTRNFKENEHRLKIVCLFDIAPESKIKCYNETIHLSTKTNPLPSSLQDSSDRSKRKRSSDGRAKECLFVTDQLESLSLDFCNLLENETFADVKLRCGDRTISAHRAVLAARSEVFAAMFRNKMAESETGIVDVADLDASQLNLFMKYVYSGKIPDLSEDVAQSLYEAGDKYAVHSLKKGCSVWIVENLTVENCLHFLILAERHSDEGLKEIVVNFVAEKLGVLRKEAWSRFGEEHPNLAIIVYEKHCAPTLSKQA